MSKFIINKNVMYQKDFRIEEEMKLIDYIKSEHFDEEILENDAIIIVSLEGRIFELNLVASIVFEGIYYGESTDDIKASLRSLFDEEESKLNGEMFSFIELMNAMGIITEV